MVRVVYTPSEPVPEERPGPIPLSHHEILGLVGPFSRRGRHVDLPASDRHGRSISFKPVDHADLPAAGQRLREVLVLEHPGPEDFRLVRRLTDPSGLTATLEIAGPDPEPLLTEIDKVPPARQFPSHAGIAVARSYRILSQKAQGDPKAEAPQTPPPRSWQLEMTGAEAHVDGVVLRVNAKTGRGMPVDLELRGEGDRRLNIPEDLFAVMGWAWRPLRHIGKSLRGSVRVAKAEPARTHVAELRTKQAVEHLVRTLSRSPAEFHSRHQGARWRVTFRRGLPLLIGLAILAATPLINFLSLENDSLVRMFIFHAPPLLLVFMFTFREMPRIEVPPLPRRLIKTAWVSESA